MVQQAESEAGKQKKAAVPAKRTYAKRKQAEEAAAEPSAQRTVATASEDAKGSDTQPMANGSAQPDATEKPKRRGRPPGKKILQRAAAMEAETSAGRAPHQAERLCRYAQHTAARQGPRPG